jgi:hypothetical protein
VAYGVRSSTITLINPEPKMSAISNRHNVRLFVSGESKPYLGQRLAKVGYKSTKQTPAKYPSICVSLPQVEIDDDTYICHQAEFSQIIRTALENAQDGILRSLYESSSGQLKSVSDDELSVQACIAFIQSENNGGRLTTEMIGAWFDSTVSPVLTLIIAEKLKFDDMTEEQMAVIGKHLNGYRGLMCSLSSGATILTPSQIQNLRNLLTKLDDDAISTRLALRLDNMSQKKSVEELLEI